VHLLVDSWVPLGVPLELLSPLACLRLRLFGAFAHRAHRPNAPLPPDKRDALQVHAPPLSAASGLAHESPPAHFCIMLSPRSH
jgi:hypothetical protein